LREIVNPLVTDREIIPPLGFAGHLSYNAVDILDPCGFRQFPDPHKL